jgi:hypothetical protein
MRMKNGSIPFEDLEKLLPDEFTTYPRIRDVQDANPKSRIRKKVELNEKNKGRKCGIYKLGSRYVGSIYIRKGTTVFVELSEEEARPYLF